MWVGNGEVMLGALTLELNVGSQFLLLISHAPDPETDPGDNFTCVFLGKGRSGYKRMETAGCSVAIHMS